MLYVYSSQDSVLIQYKCLSIAHHDECFPPLVLVAAPELLPGAEEHHRLGDDGGEHGQTHHQEHNLEQPATQQAWVIKPPFGCGFKSCNSSKASNISYSTVGVEAKQTPFLLVYYKRVHWTVYFVVCL